MAIDRADSGSGRRRFFEKRLAAVHENPDDFVHVGVMDGDALCGFAIAHVLRGEFGREGAIAVLDALAVDPAKRNRGIGQVLVKELDAHLQRAGVRLLHSQIDWRRHDLARFFAAAGFSLAPRMALERSVAAPLHEVVEEV
ncbi:MAG: GNAT family N-acetyltransferase [Bradyrhizobiaceae bacterium]|nr:GNAT family N-acetyltransferase [Bradyrhizobiaceae bacterium]